MSDDPFDGFDMSFGKPAEPAPTPQVPPDTIGMDETAMLQANAKLALQRQMEILTTPLGPDTDVRERKLVAETAHQVLKTGVSLDQGRYQKRTEAGGSPFLAALIEKCKQLRKEKRVMLDAVPFERLPAPESD